MEALQAGRRVTGSSGTRLLMLIAVATALTTTSMDGLGAGLFVKKRALHPGSKRGMRVGAGVRRAWKTPWQGGSGAQGPEAPADLRFDVTQAKPWSHP